MRELTPRVKRLIAGAAASSALSLAFASAAAAKPTWLPSKPLAAGSGNAIADIATDPAGEATAVWSTEGAGEPAVEAATRTPFGSFGLPIRLSPAKAEAKFPQVAADAEGVASVVWANLTCGCIEATTLDRGLPSSSKTLSPEGVAALFPSVSVSSSGAAIAAWEASDEAGSRIEAAYRPAGRTFGAAQRLSPRERSVGMFTSSGIDEAGEAVVAWTDEGERKTVEVASTAGGAVLARTALSNAESDAANPAVAVNAAGDAAVAWTEGEEPGAPFEALRIATRSSGGSFRSPVALATKGSSVEYPRVALDAGGEPTLAWIEGGSVVVAEGTTSGFSSTQRLAHPALYPSVSEDDAGDALVSWLNPEAGSAEAGFRPAGGGFAVPHTISPAQEAIGAPFGPERPPVTGAVLGDGDALAAFALEGDGAPSVAMLDAAGPQLNGLSMPAAGFAGQPVSFSVSPIDQITSVASTTWTFGDATSVAGTSVQHTFAEPGAYTVEVTSTDASGNETTASGTISISTPSQLEGRFAGARLIGGSTRANTSGGFRLKVRCVASRACANGVVRLTLNLKVDGLPTASLKLGRDGFKLAAGARTYVTFKLKRPLLKLLRKQRRFKVVALVEASTYRGQTATSTGKATVKAPRQRHEQGRKQRSARAAIRR